MDANERAILTSINGILINPHVQAKIDEIADRVARKFTSSTEALAWETVPLETYGTGLPAMIRSSWVFLLREGANSGAERHPNSHQRVRSWRGSGDFQVWRHDGWKSHFLQNRLDAPVEEQWATIETNVWHRAVVPPGRHWIVLSFHTASTEDLMEETPEANDVDRMRQRVYSRVQS